jgi:hypothetical protein
MLADPHRAMEGSGRYTRSIRFRTPDEIDPRVVVPILRQAAERQTEMLQSKRAERQNIPRESPAASAATAAAGRRRRHRPQ